MTATKSSAAALALALGVLYVGLRWGSTVAGGSDSSGYVVQSGLWQARGLIVRQEIVSDSPWPFAAQTWTPLGFVPSPRVRDAIVPSYAPGYPLLMALAQLIAGYCAAFVVAPLCGAFTIWSTYQLGRRLFASTAIALGGALLVAASPVFLHQLMNPMSDVPVTAAWTTALWLAIAQYPLGAGVASAIAIAIRPNLAPLIAVLFAWLAATNRVAIVRAAVGVVPALVGIALLNAYLYGSPFRSGYGSLAEIYALGNVSSNVRLYSAWLMDVQTPVVVLAALFFVAPGLVATRIRAPRILLGGTIGVMVASYLFYTPFDAWWYLRFLLPMWPVLLLLTVAVLAASAARVAPQATRARAIAVSTIIAAVAVHGVWIAVDRGAFAIGAGERRYAEVGRFLAHLTDPDAVMLSWQQSGSLRMYADRLTLRFDVMDPRWLDRAVAYLQTSGRHPYLVLDGGEDGAFRRRFAASRIGALDWQPIAVYDTPRVAIYDAIDRTNQHAPLVLGRDDDDRAPWRCEKPQIWPPRLRMK